MSTTEEFRFAVGRPTGPRSCVWKLWVQRNDVHVQPRMMGSDAKVSLHESGRGNYSLTTAWLREKAPHGFARAERHMCTWPMPQPDGRKSAHVFRIIIPADELRPLNSGEDLSAVTWLPAPAPGQAAVIDCYLTPPVKNRPDAAASPHKQLTSLGCHDGRWLVALVRTGILGQRIGNALEDARRQVRAAAKAKGLAPNPRYRAALFVEGNGDAKGLIELIPF